MPQNNPIDSDKIAPPQVRGARLLVVTAGLLCLGFVYWYAAGRPLHSTKIAIETYEKTSQFVREGEHLKVPPGSPLRDALRIETVREREIHRTLVFPAVVEAEPQRLIKVLPPLTGRVVTLMAQLGEHVGAGQPLLTFDSPDLAGAYADYDRAKVLLALALKSRDRQRGLARIGGAAEKELQQAETDYVTAEAEYTRTESRLRQIGIDPAKTDKSRLVTIAAPMAGSIIDLAAAPGAYWNDQNTALMTVADLSTVWVTANVPEKDIALIAKGQAADVTFVSYPNEIFSGRVLFVSDVVDADTRRTKVRIALENPGARFRLNMFADVTFLGARQTMPVVPTAALVLENETDRVFVETAPWVFKQRTVEIAFQKGEEAIIKSGLKAGDRMVVTGGVLLSD